MKPTLALNLSQQLALTPQLQQAIRLLQLSVFELHSEIQEALEANPMLEWDEDPGETASAAIRNKPSERPLDTTQDWDHISEPAQTLTDYLSWQMSLTPFTERDRHIAMSIIDGINDDGYLEIAISDIADGARLPDDEEVIAEDEVLAVLHRIQHFDPIGVGARTLQECLAVQANTHYTDHPDKHLIDAIISKHLNDIARKDYAVVKKSLRLSDARFTTLLTLIQDLQPKPGQAFGPSNTQYIVPDAFVTKVDDHWVVKLNTNYLPKIRLQTAYAEHMPSASKEDKLFLREQLKEAKWFIKSLENRQSAIHNVLSVLLIVQKDFLERGAIALKPMVLQDVADAIGMHTSSISRITANKYIDTPHGVLPLKYFFSNAVPSNDGQTHSAIAIKSRLARLIRDEDPHAPLSDARLCECLQEEGVTVARRTVAKYREALQVAPAYQRKKK